MSKHDARISKTKYIITMVLAILISLGAGIGSGYLIAKYKDSNFDNEKVIQGENKDELKDKDDIKLEDSEKKDNSDKKNDDLKETDEHKVEEKEAEDKKQEDGTDKQEILSDKQQLDISKSLINSLYSIDSKAYASLLTQSEQKYKQSSRTKSQTDIFREELYKQYEKILNETSLTNIKKVINSGSLEDYYFSDYFNSKRNTKIKSINVVSFNNNIIKAKTTITNEFLYYSIPNSSDFFSTLKGTGLTKEQYIKMIKQGPKRIRVIETRNDEFDIKKISDKWYIVTDKSSISSTAITEVIFEDKIYTIDEFKRKYL